MRTTVLVLLACFTPAALAAYKCVDEKGVTRIGDTPPPECANVVMYETSRSGMVIKKIDPTPTAEQVRQRKEEAERRAAAEKLAAEQKRKDTALLNSFTAASEFDLTRDRQIEPIKGRIKLARERIEDIDKRRKAIHEDMEFYKAGKRRAAGAKPGEPPPLLVDEDERLVAEKKSLESTVARAEKEIEQLKARFEVDKKRWIALKAEQGKLEAKK
jgi:hypothetical protein